MARPSLLALLGAFIMLATGGCAYLGWLPFVDAQQWQAVASARITAYTLQGEEDPPPAATMEAMEAAYSLLHASLFPAKPIAPVEALLLDWPEFRQLLGTRRTQAVVGRLPGKSVHGQRGLLVLYRHEPSIAGAAHRLAHLFLHARAPQAPIWLHEGLATYLESAHYREGSEQPVACLGQLPPRGPDVPLGRLFAMSWPELDDAEQGAALRFAAANVIDYLMMAEGGRLREKLSELIDALAEGAETVPAMVKLYPQLRPSVLQEKLRAHRQASENSPRGVCPIPYPIAADRVAAKSAFKITEAEQADIERLWSQLRLLPRRSGHVDWFPPEMIGIEGGQVRRPVLIP